MSRLFDDASAQYLTCLTTPVTAPPFTLAGWGRVDASPGDMTLIGLGDASAADDWHAVWFETSSGGTVRVLSRDASTKYAQTTTTWGINAWHHLCGVYATTASRIAYLDGGGKDEETTNKTPDNIDSIVIGVRPGTDGDKEMSGMIAHCAMWNAALSDEEVASLARGYSPLFIRPQNLVCYWPLLRTDQDIVGGYDLTPVNAPTWGSNHPPVIMPASIFYSLPVIVVGGEIAPTSIIYGPLFGPMGGPI